MLNLRVETGMAPVRIRQAYPAQGNRIRTRTIFRIILAVRGACDDRLLETEILHMSYDTMTVVRDEFRADVKRAIDVLRSEGASDVYVFGSVVEPESRRSPSDLDLAVSGLPPERFFHVYGVLVGELEHDFDLVDLDQDSRFVRAIREWGPIERVG